MEHRPQWGWVYALAAVAVVTGCSRGGRAPGPLPPQVVIVGGGIAGLVTASELERQGVSTHLLEAADRLGGRIATARYGPGLEAEFGMQEIWSGSPLAQVAREVGLTLEGEGALSSVMLDGKLHPYTQTRREDFLSSVFSPSELTALKRWMGGAENLLTELKAKGFSPPMRRLNDLSFGAWLKEHRLPPRVEAWIRLTLECEVGADLESFSALSGLAELRVYLFGGESALHVVGGNSRLVEALGERLKGPKTLRARVTRVRRTRAADGKLTVVVDYLRDNQWHKLEADRVVIAVPWMVLHTIQLDPPLPADAWESLMTLGRGQYTVVHLLIDKKAHALWGGADRSPFPVLTPGPLGVVYGVASPSPREQPLEVFSLLVHGHHARGFHLAQHEGKREEMVQELETLWPGFSRHVRDAAIYPYHPAAVAYWPPGRSPYDEKSQALFQAFDGLYLVGDYLVSSHSEGAVVAAFRQARALTEELQAPQ